MVEALIFDVDGTLAETEELHRAAFNRAFAEAGLSHKWDRALYRELLETTGGKRRIARYFERMGLPADEALAAELHVAKNRHYAEAVGAGVRLRPGVATLIAAAGEAGVRCAIATTTSRSNLEGLLQAVEAEVPTEAFEVIVCGEDVSALKPDPEAYLLALELLGLGPDKALAFEDSANGLRAAVAAGIRTVVTPSLYTDGQDFSGAALVVEDLSQFDFSPFCPTGEKMAR